MAQQKTKLDLELEAIDEQSTRMSVLSLSTIVVSFIHMVVALALFSDGSWYGNLAAFLMTALVDGATWVVTKYLDYSKRLQKARSWFIKALLGLALFISFGLNFAYMLSHAPKSVPMLLAVAIGLAFSVFIPACIAIPSLAAGELEDDRLQLRQAALAEQPAPALPMHAEPYQPALPQAPMIGQTRRLSKPPRQRLPKPATRPALPAPEVDDDDQSVNVDFAKRLDANGIDERASLWLELNQDQGLGSRKIKAYWFDNFNENVSYQYIGKHIKLLRDQQNQERIDATTERLVKAGTEILKRITAPEPDDENATIDDQEA